MPSTKKSVKSAQTVLLDNAKRLVNFVTPDADGHIPASANSPEAVMANVGYRASRILAMARKIAKKPAATKGCERTTARS